MRDWSPSSEAEPSRCGFGSIAVHRDGPAPDRRIPVPLSEDEIETLALALMFEARRALACGLHPTARRNIERAAELRAVAAPHAGADA